MKDKDLQDSEFFRDVNVNQRDAVRFKRFVVHELIGVGGMAEVYKASGEKQDGDTDSIVLKRIKKEHAKNKSFIQMFMDEAKLSARMKHPNIVEVYEYGEHLGIHYLAMEYIDGLHLQAAHKRYEEMYGSSLPWQVVTLIIRDVLQGLRYAHELADEHGEPLGLIHRDVNLDNVMITRDGRVKLLDFGIVKAREGIRAAETAAGVLKGKFGYMSPEQVAGKPLKPCSDIFSTGIVFHELLTGRRLFFGDDDLSILIAVKSGPIPDPRMTSDVSEDVPRVVLKALERDIEKRYQSAAEMILDLNKIIERHGIHEEFKADLTTDMMESGKDTAGGRRNLRKTMEAWAHAELDGSVRSAEQDPVSNKVNDMEALNPGRWMVSGTLGSVDPFGSDEAGDTSLPSSPRSSPPSGRLQKKTKYMWGGAGSGEEAEEDLGEYEAPALDDGESTVVDATVPEITDDTVPERSLAEAETRILEDGEEIAAVRGPGVSETGLTEAETRILEDGEEIAAVRGPGVSETGLTEAETASSRQDSKGGKQSNIKLMAVVVLGATLLVAMILYVLGVIR